MLIVGCLVLLAACFPASPTPGEGSSIQTLPALKEQYLTGKLLLIEYRKNGNQLIQLDLASGETKTLFSAPDKSWLGAAEVSPDHQQILIAYAPPPPEGQIQLASTDLYLLPIDGSGKLKPLMVHDAPNESFTNPAWAPDGQSVYYTHNVPSSETKSGIQSRVERVSLDGRPQELIKDAIWPRPSPDGQKVAYLTVVQLVSHNELYIMNADGSNPTPANAGDKFNIVDAHVFSPDGKSILFSSINLGAASSAEPPKPGWTFGVKPVYAHSNPSDWFLVNIETQQVKQLTNIQQAGLIPAFSPDGQRVAFISEKGLFVMQPDGSQIVQIANLSGIGSLNWIP